MNRAIRCLPLLLGATLWVSAQEPPPHKVVVIGIDGLRVDQIEKAETPHLDRLFREGAGCTSATNAWTPDDPWNASSAANWGVLLTGVTPGESGLTHNGDREHRVADDRTAGDDRVLTVFGHLKRFDPGIETGVFNSWPGIGSGEGTILERSASAVDRHVQPSRSASPADQDGTTVRAAVQAIGSGVDALFVHVLSCDVAGHRSTWGSEAYLRALAHVDALLGEILAAVRKRERTHDERWMVVVTSDHGGAADGKHHDDNTDPGIHTIPFIVRHESIEPRRLSSASLYDVVPTVLGWMGRPIEADEFRGNAIR